MFSNQTPLIFVRLSNAVSILKSKELEFSDENICIL